MCLWEEFKSALCPFHNSEFSYITGDLKMWVGSEPDQIQEKCDSLEIIPAKEIDSYIWVQKDI